MIGSAAQAEPAISSPSSDERSPRNAARYCCTWYSSGLVMVMTGQTKLFQ